MRLGGNIELYGSENLDGATMIVLKKIIGTYARKFSEKGLERLAVSFGDKAVRVEAVVQGSTHSADKSHDNIFFCIDAALKEIESKF